MLLKPLPKFKILVIRIPFPICRVVFQEHKQINKSGMVQVIDCPEVSYNLFIRGDMSQHDHKIFNPVIGNNINFDVINKLAAINPLLLTIPESSLVDIGMSHILSLPNNYSDSDLINFLNRTKPSYMEDYVLEGTENPLINIHPGYTINSTYGISSTLSRLITRPPTTNLIDPEENRWLDGRFA